MTKSASELLRVGQAAFAAAAPDSDPYAPGQPLIAMLTAAAAMAADVGASAPAQVEAMFQGFLNSSGVVAPPSDYASGSVSFSAQNGTTLASGSQVSVGGQTYSTQEAAFQTTILPAILSIEAIGVIADIVFAEADTNGNPSPLITGAVVTISGTTAVGGSNSQLFNGTWTLTMTSPTEGQFVLNVPQNSEVTASGGTAAWGHVTATIQATNGGAQANNVWGATATLSSAPAGISATGAVSGNDGLTGGAVSGYTARQLALGIYQAPVNQFNVSNIRSTLLRAFAWCSKVFVQVATPAPGQVTVTLVANGGGTPTVAQLSEATQLLLDIAPATVAKTFSNTLPGGSASVVVVGAVSLPINMTAQINPSTAAMQTAVSQSLSDYLLNQGGGSVITGTTLSAAIVNATTAGGQVLVNGTVTLANSVTLAQGQVATLGTVTWLAPTV